MPPGVAFSQQVSSGTCILLLSLARTRIERYDSLNS
jgi:hypothetical protein